MPRRSRRPKPIPRSRTNRTQSERLDFTGGINSYSTNDIASTNTLDLAQDARTHRQSEYTTRYGAREYSVPIGEAVEQSQTTSSGSVAVSDVDWYSQIITGVTRPITKLDLSLSQTDAAGVLAVIIHDDAGGLPGNPIAYSSIATADIAITSGVVSCRFIEAPTPPGDVHVVVYMQKDGRNSIDLETDTAGTGMMVSDNAGLTWNTYAGAMVYTLHTSEPGGVKGVYRARRNGNPDVTLMAHGAALYEVNDATGATTAVGTISPNSTKVRFDMVDDAIFYADGVGKPRKYDFATDIEVADANRNARNVIEYHEHLFYLDPQDLNRAEYTEAGNYETHPSTHFRFFPTFNTNDPAVAWNKLNGLLYVQTLGSMYVLFGTDADTWQTDQATSQVGTYTQESTVVDDNFIYFASDEGIHRFDGANAPIISLGIQDQWDELLTKTNTVLELHKNRLFVHYTPNGEVSNTKRFVFNIIENKWESVDTGTPFGCTYNDHNADSVFYVASNKVGAVYIDEDPNNNHHNLGGKLDYRIYTHFDHFGAPSQLKDIRNLEPRFAAEDNDYEVTVEFATDGKTTTIPLLNNAAERVMLGSGGARYDSGVTYDSGVRYDGGEAVIRPEMHVGGCYFGIQRRYSHCAAREPVTFLGETIEVWVQRD